MTKKNELQKIGIFPVGLQTKQVKATAQEGTRGEGDQKPDDTFSTLARTYDENFCVGGIADKVASSCDSGFVKISHDSKEEQAKNLNNLLESLDLEQMFLEMFSLWNSFQELIRNQEKGGVATFDRVLPETIVVSNSKEIPKLEDAYNIGQEDHERGYHQWSGWESAYFGYWNIVHFKTNNMRSKFYGKSKFYKTIDQVILLTNIDKFYNSLMKRGNMKVKLLTDPQNSLTDKQKEAISNIITDAWKGLDNAFASLFVPAEIKSLNLEDDTDTKAFLDYRNDLIKSICVGCNFPYDLLISDNSNRSTSEVAQEQLNETIVKWFHSRALKTIKSHLKMIEAYDEDLIEMIEFNKVDTTNGKEQMEVLTWYKKAAVISANEARKLSPYELEEREDGDELKGETKEYKENQAMETIEKTMEGRYSKANLQRINKTYVQQLPQQG